MAFISSTLFLTPQYGALYEMLSGMRDSTWQTLSIIWACTEVFAWFNPLAIRPVSEHAIQPDQIC